MNEEKQKQFEEVVKPVIKWLAENKHPHSKIIIESNSVEGTMVLSTDEFLVD